MLLAGHDRLAVFQRGAVVCGGVKAVQSGQIDDTGPRRAVLHHGQRDGEDILAGDEGTGAINRIENELKFGFQPRLAVRILF